MKKFHLALTLLLCFFPFLTHGAGSLQTLLTTVPAFLSGIIIPFLFGIAFLFFVINVIRYFVIGGSNEQERDKAKTLAVYSVLAFTFLIIFWGIVNIITAGIGLEGQTPPCPDYILKADPSKCP